MDPTLTLNLPKTIATIALTPFCSDAEREAWRGRRPKSVRVTAWTNQKRVGKRRCGCPSVTVKLATDQSSIKEQNPIERARCLEL